MFMIRTKEQRYKEKVSQKYATNINEFRDIIQKRSAERDSMKK